MCSFTIAAAFGLASACAMAGPSTLLDPANPHIAIHHRVARSVTAGLAPFAPADPKDWRLMNKGVSPEGEGQGGMSSVPGMGGMKGMQHMPGMEMGK